MLFNHKYIHQVNYYECDGMGVVHHSNYVRFMEEARIDWMAKIGYGYDRMEAAGVVSPIVNIECKYQKTTKFRDIIEIEVIAIDFSPVRLTFSYTMKVAGETVFTAKSVNCFTQNGHPIRLDRTLPEACEAILSQVSQA